MPTPFQFEANRRNAQFSTGPRTAAGKAASSRNAVKHNLAGSAFALLPGEDIDAFERLARDYRDEWKPKTPHEDFLVNTMVQARWRLDRIARMEAEAFDQLLNVPAADGKTDEAALVALYPMRGQLLDKLQRYARDNERAYHRAVREFKAYRKAQAEEKKQESPARNEPKSPSSEKVFVASRAPEPPAMALSEPPATTPALSATVRSAAQARRSAA